MKNNDMEASNNTQERISLVFIIEGKIYKTCDQYKTGVELKRMAGIPLAIELFLSIKKPYEDELIENETKVNLARPEVEEFFVKKKLSFTINGIPFNWYKQFVSGSQLRKLGNISPEDEIFLDLPDGWKDDFISDDEFVDLARPGIEKFVTRAHEVNFIIYVNSREKEWKKRMIDYQDVVRLAFPNPNYEIITYTVDYSLGPRQNPSGSMTKGDIRLITNNMNFNVTDTNRS